MNTPNTYSPETTSFVEALRALLEAEEKTLSAFTTTYGDSIPEDGGLSYGENFYNRSKFPGLFEALKNEAKDWISSCVEMEVTGALEPKKEEEVC